MDVSTVCDSYIEGLMEQGQETKVDSYCKECGSELFVGEEVVVDYFNNNFCDKSCAKIFHDIKETEEANGSWCFYCGDVLNTEDYEVYIDSEGSEFCSIECAEEGQQLQYQVLEEEEDEDGI